MTKGGSIILRIYFALVSFVTLMMLIFSVSDIINIVLKTYVFKAAGESELIVYCDPQYQTEEQCARQKDNARQNALAQKQQSAVRDISLLVVAVPLFWVHWRFVYKDWLEDHEKKEA